MKKKAKCCRRRLPHIHFANGTVLVLATMKEWRRLKGTSLCTWAI